MKYNIKKLYAIDGAGNGVAKDFDYARVENSLNSIERNIANIMDALSKRITVTSYEGDAQEEVNNAVDSIRTYLSTMEKPLNDMKGKITEVKEAYAGSEASIKSALSGIGSRPDIEKE